MGCTHNCETCGSNCKSAKENEIKNLRMVLTGKLAGTAEETIKERLRETYV